ncbi:LURP-one-related [Dillenia turbinata]|uniref:LURP-one-related n=1 Tax=Dillenia turbinata TaxID=194707 RepID=A0AAN8ZCF0_9MAGN
MAKVHPNAFYFYSSNSLMNTDRETYTIWMKSLIYNSNGCTIFNSKGDIVYRIDNYTRKCSSEVYLMDIRGQVLFTLRRKKLSLFRCWEGYRSSNLDTRKETPMFRVRENCRILKRDLLCQVNVGCDRSTATCYSIEGLFGKSDFQILDHQRRIIAEAKQKVSASGVLLGEDVSSLVVESGSDHSFIIALIAVYGLINHKM